MMPEAAYVLFSTAAWRDPVVIGKFFVVPDTAITETKQKTHGQMWHASKDLRDNFKNVQTELKTIFERIINPAYHSVGMGCTGFGTDEAPAILQRLQTLYGKPSLGELEADLLRLHDPMERNQPVELMIQDMEEVQIFSSSSTPRIT